MEYPVDVFISHHTSTCLPVTQAICHSLESSGLRCWYAPRDTQQAYASSIVSAINRCSVFVLVLNRYEALADIYASIGQTDKAIATFRDLCEKLDKRLDTTTPFRQRINRKLAALQ